jgi:hypothetical protein
MIFITDTWLPTLLFPQEADMALTTLPCATALVCDTRRNLGLILLPAVHAAAAAATNFCY